MKYLLNKINKDDCFMNLINDIITNSTVQKMKNYRQHFDTNCFDHCLLASYYCYVWCKKYNLDYVACARAAMLHDLFLYDWRKRQYYKTGMHAYTHPKIAYENACKFFVLNSKESDIILKHMWPVTIALPHYKESYVLTFVDKYCAVLEFASGLFSIIFKSKFLKYAYIFLCLFFVQI